MDKLTPEEILKNNYPFKTPAGDCYTATNALTAMKEYADQEVAERDKFICNLQVEIDKLKIDITLEREKREAWKEIAKEILNSPLNKNK